MKIEKEDIQSFFDHFLSQQKFFVVEGLVAKSNAGVITRFPIKMYPILLVCLPWMIRVGCDFCNLQNPSDSSTQIFESTF